MQLKNFYVVRDEQSKPIPEEFVRRIERYCVEHNVNGYLEINTLLGSNSEGKVEVDALLVTRQCGVMIFNIRDDVDGVDELVATYNSLVDDADVYFKYHKDLRKARGRGLAFDCKVVTIVPRLTAAIKKLGSKKYCIRTLEDVEKILSSGAAFDDEELYNRVCSALQPIDLLGELNRAAKTLVEGAQRIRGLGGSGKTRALALKAALMHTKHPEWRIAVVSRTPELRDWFRARIAEDYAALNLNRTPAWDRLRVMSVDELSSEGAAEFDAMLLGKAQELSAESLRSAYRVTREPKRIVWTYDELESVDRLELSTPEEMFGVGADGRPLVELARERDIVVEECRRNSPRILTLAHALKFGIYRKPGKSIVNKILRKIDRGIVQMFDEPEHWLEIGYEVVDGALEVGREVTLRRRADVGESNAEDCVRVQVCGSKAEEYRWAASEIEKDVSGGLKAEEILAVFMSRSFESDRELFVRELSARGIEGVDCFSVRQLHGLNTPIVYVLDADVCAGGSVKARHQIFSALICARQKLRIAGVGAKMSRLADEIKACIDNDFTLKFVVPEADK